MRAIFINAKDQRVSEIEIGNSTDEFVQLIGSYICQAFRVPDSNSVCFVDDEGMINNTQHFFEMDYCSQPFAGNGLIVGISSIGNSISTRVSLDKIKKSIKFYGVATLLAKLKRA